MRSQTLPSRRVGFTLIELLVVVSILTILAAMTMAGISRVRAGQNKATTEGTVKKLQTGLEQQLKASMDQATDDKNTYLPLVKDQFADGDKDRAKALLAYLACKRDFPQTFAEARNGLTLPGTSPPATLPPSRAFVAIPAGVYPPEIEAANLLYIIVHDNAKRGTSIDADGSLTGAEMITPATGLKAYKDAYGTPIAFIRWYGPYLGTGTFPFAMNNDTQAPPFVNLNNRDLSNVSFLDPYDRLGTDRRAKLRDWNNATNRALALGVLNSNYSPTFYPGTAPNPALGIQLFDGTNKIMTAVSAGPDKAFGTADDIYGYPLARLGAKGD